MIYARKYSPLISLSLTSALALTGCIGGEKTTDSAGDDSSSSSSTSTGGSTGTSDPGGSTTGETSSGTSGATTHDSHATHTSDGTSDGTTGAATGTTGDAGIPESCVDACEVLLGCSPLFPTLDECVATCIDESTPREPNPACEGASVAFNQCLATLTCEQIESEDFPCEAEEEAVQELCGGGEDECVGGGGIEEDTCSVYEICPDYDYEVQCSEKGCVCLEGGTEIKSCPPMGGVNACEDFETLSAAALACCGWDL
jgi:hypothetical protein